MRHRKNNHISKSIFEAMASEATHIFCAYYIAGMSLLHSTLKFWNGENFRYTWKTSFFRFAYGRHFLVKTEIPQSILHNPKKIALFQAIQRVQTIFFQFSVTHYLHPVFQRIPSVFRRYSVNGNTKKCYVLRWALRASRAARARPRRRAGYLLPEPT